MKKTKRFLSMLVVLGIFASMLSGISVSAAEDPFEYDFIVDGWKTTDNVTDVVENEGVIKASANYTTRLIASHAFDKTLRNTTVVFSFKFMSEFVSADDQYTISQMYVKNGMGAAQDGISSSVNMPAFAILGNGDFGYYSDPGENANAWDNLVTPEAFKGYGKWSTWYQIDCVYDLTAGKVKYYVDGVFLGEGNGPNALNYIMFVPHMGNGLPRGNTYYTDITVRELGEFITLTKDEENSTEDTIVVKVSEPLANPADLKVYDVETLEAVDVESEKIDEFTYSFDVTGLKYGAEYKVSVPAGVNGIYGNTTKAGDIYFNIADASTLVATTQGTPGGQIFEENFNRFSDRNVGTDESSGTTNIGVEDADGRLQWERFGNTTWGFNTYARKNILRLDGWGWTNAASTGVKSKINTNITDSDVEIMFDAESQTPESNTIDGFFDFVVYDSLANVHPVFQISGETVRMCKNLQYSEHIITSYKNSNKLTDYTKTTLENYTSYKIILKMVEGVAELYAKIDGNYTLIGSTTINETLAKNGFADIGFRMEKVGGGHRAKITATYIDNVSVVTGPTPAPANFADTFSYASKDAMFSSENAKWETVGAQSAGANVKVDNNALRLDLWAWTSGTYTGAKTNMDENVTKGTVEFFFDAAQHNPAENATNGWNCYFEFGLFDAAGSDSTANWHPVMQIQGEEVRICTNMASTNTSVPVTFENANDITKFTSYKVVLDMDAKTAKVYAVVGDEYTEIGSTTINDTLISRGINEAMFRMVKITGGTHITANTSAKVDNFEVYIKNKAVVPVVKSVRFDGVGASDEVSVNTEEIKIYFNKDMDETTLGNISIDGAVYSGTYSADEMAYVIEVSSFLKNTDYIINVPTTVKSIDGVALGREYNGVFHTEEGAFEISSFTLKEGNADAAYEDTEAGDTLTAAVTITNEAGRTGSYVLLYAVYDGNKLAKIDYVDVPFDAEHETTTKDISFVVPETEDDLYIKVMLWESLSTLKPVVEAIGF